MEDFKTQVTNVTRAMNGVLATTSVRDHDAAWTAAKPNYDKLQPAYDVLYGVLGHKERSQLDKLYDGIGALYTKLKKHRESLMSKDEDPRPPQGGRKRKMTRRYCKKTPCRKMGFTQKASCRPWKNCY